MPEPLEEHPQFTRICDDFRDLESGQSSHGRNAKLDDLDMILPIVALLASFVAATVLGLLGAYFAGYLGAVVGMAIGILLAFFLIARRAGR